MARLLFAVFVTGGALPAGGPSAVNGFDVVEEDEKSTQGEGAQARVRAVRQGKRGMDWSRGFEVFEVPRVLASSGPVVQAPTWMRPRRTPPPDDDDAAV